MNKKPITIIAVVLLVAALGLFIFAVVTQRFELRRRAISGEPTPTPIVTATDDLYFDNSHTIISFETTDQNPNVSIDPTKLLPGKTYVITATYQIQNNEKSQEATTAGIPVVMLANNWFVSAKDLPFSLVAGHADGALDVQSASFTALGGTNTIELQIDPNNIFSETNEGNNKLTLSFVSPLPTCNPTDINKDGITDIVDYSYLVSDFFKTNPTNPRSDINGDGIVDVTDYSLLVASFFSQTGACQ